MTNLITRRTFVGSVAGAAGVAAFGGSGFAQATLPTSPVTLNIIDVAGNLALNTFLLRGFFGARR